MIYSQDYDLNKKKLKLDLESEFDLCSAVFCDVIPKPDIIRQSGAILAT